MEKLKQLEENLKIYNYLDYFLKKEYNIDYSYFKNHILKGDCDLLKKLNINKELCEEWKKRCINDKIELENKNNKNNAYEKLIKEFLNILG